MFKLDRPEFRVINALQSEPKATAQAQLAIFAARDCLSRLDALTLVAVAEKMYPELSLVDACSAINQLVSDFASQVGPFMIMAIKIERNEKERLRPFTNRASARASAIALHLTSFELHIKRIENSVAPSIKELTDKKVSLEAATLAIGDLGVARMRQEVVDLVAEKEQLEKFLRTKNTDDLPGGYEDLIAKLA